jgi:hypothetical protein
MMNLDVSREEIAAFLASLKKLRDGLDAFNCELAGIDGARFPHPPRKMRWPAASAQVRRAIEAIIKPALRLSYGAGPLQGCTPIYAWRASRA